MNGVIKYAHFALIFFSAVVAHWTDCSSLHADATTVKQEINAVYTHIQDEINAINQLAADKKLGEALDRLLVLNNEIDQSLVPVFYDAVIEVRREEPGYTPPGLTVDLGTYFTPAFWDTKIQQAESAYKNAVEALESVSAMRKLNAQDAAFADLKIVFDTISTLKDAIEDIVTSNYVQLADDLYSGADAFIENYKAVEEARLAGLTTDLFEIQNKMLARRAETTLERMRNLKSAMIVYRSDILDFKYHLKNIAHYTTRAVQDPVFPLNFSSTIYNFDITPHIAALDSLKTDFENGKFCWTVLEKIYRRIQQEAAAQRGQIVTNIEGSPEPVENKQVYLDDVNSNWSYFNAHADDIYTTVYNIRVSVLDQYDLLNQAVETLAAQRNAIVDSYWDETGFVRQDLRTFREADYGILQVGILDIPRPGPYYLARDYAPSFPISPDVSNFEMPARTPDIQNFPFDDYPDGLVALAAAYRTMAESALVQDSNETWGSGTPVADFALSPLSRNLMDDVEYNLYRVRDQILDFETFMNNKESLVPEAFAKQEQLETALAELAAHVDENQRYLCLDGASISRNAVDQWDGIIAPVMAANWHYADASEDAVIAVDTHLSYIQNQNVFNDALKNASDLIQSMENEQVLFSLLSFIINDYVTLPDLPSEQGYTDFLTELDYLHAFYGPADMDRIMDLRESVLTLFDQVYGGGRWFSQLNSFCVMPENLDIFQQLITMTDTWGDLYMNDVRKGFTGWDVWARRQLNMYWPEGNTDDIQPGVAYFTPGRNSEDVPVYQTLRIGFTEKIDVRTLTDTTVLLEANGRGRPRRLVYGSAENRLLIDPGRMLPDTAYTVSLTEGVTDTAGNSLVPERWSFTTASVSTSAWVSIDITGVADGESYAEPVTIGISVSTGDYRAELRMNGGAPQPVDSGHTISMRGRYLLSVIADQGLSRTVDFVVGTGVEDYALDAVDSFLADPRPFTVTDDRYMGIGKRYFVDGNRYFYNYGGEIYLYDLLTANNQVLFDAGYYYQTEGGVNVEPSTYCSFLDVSGDRILYCKNTGAEGAGLTPDAKMFQLFVYDLSTGKSFRVPGESEFSQTSGFIDGSRVVWIAEQTGAVFLFTWRIGDEGPETLLEFTGLEKWQSPELLGFDGEWVLYRIGDGNGYVYQNLDGIVGYDYREPKGESLHGYHIPGGQRVELLSWNPEQPYRVAFGDVHQGIAAFMIYQMHGNTVTNEFNETAWADTCDTSRLYLQALFSDRQMLVSRQPQIGDGQRFMMSESLLYWVNRNTAAPFSITDATYTSELSHKTLDLMTKLTIGANPGTRPQAYELFGDRMITDDPAAKIITFGKPISSVAVTGRTPEPDAGDVALDTAITVAFSGPMAEKTMTSEWIALSRVDGQGQFVERVPLEMQYDPASFTLTLSHQGLVSGARYRMFVAGNVEDASNHALVQPLSWYFTTQDITGPVLLSSLPADGSSVLTPGGTITLYFDEKVNSDTVADGIGLSAAGEPAAFTAGANDDGTLVITPDSPLRHDTRYTLTGSTSLTDMAGNSMPVPFVLSFRTVGEYVSAAGGAILYGDSMIGSVSRVDADGQNSETLITESVSTLRWESSGNRIFVVSQNQELLVINADGTGAAIVATGLPWNFIPDISPDGTCLLYAAQREGLWGYELIRNNMDGTDPVILYTVETDTITDVAWSPNGAHIAFVWNHGTLPPELGILSVASGEAVFREDLTYPVWSPDGSRLYAVGRVEENNFESALISLTPDLLQAEAVVSLTSILGAAVSPSGEYLALYQTEGISVVDLVNGKKSRRLLCASASMGPIHLFWSLDETEILFNGMGVTDAFSPGIFALDVVNGRVAAVTTFAGMPAAPMDWLPPSGGVLPPPVTATVSDLSTTSSVNIRIDWSGYAERAEITAFRIYRETTPFTYVSGLSPLAETAAAFYDDQTALVGTPYFYGVTAVAGSGMERRMVAPIGPVTPSDNDGLPDEWEKRYFGGLSSLPEADTDKDGLTHLQEMLEHTDPTNFDTDGDFAPDGFEVMQGMMNPLNPDVIPIKVGADTVEVQIGETSLLTATGGSSSYQWAVSEQGIVEVNSEGNCIGRAEGTVTITAKDALFPGLQSDPVTIFVVPERFALRPPGDLTVQPDGYLELEVSGGSGLFEWRISDMLAARMEIVGSRTTLMPLAEAGQFEVTVTDLARKNRDPLTARVTIGNVPGDVTGNSKVELEDALFLFQAMTRIPILFDISLYGDVNGDGKLGLKESVYILKRVAQHE